MSTYSNAKLMELMNNIHQEGLPCYPLIVAFCIGGIDAWELIPMPRIPSPKVGWELSSNFADQVSDALALNPSIHDGALAFCRVDSSAAYKLYGWSMRVISQNTPEQAEENRGSAYNSALALSLGKNIDLVCLFTADRPEFYFNGKVIQPPNTTASETI